MVHGPAKTVIIISDSDSDSDIELLDIRVSSHTDKQESSGGSDVELLDIPPPRTDKQKSKDELVARYKLSFRLVLPPAFDDGHDTRMQVRDSTQPSAQLLTCQHPDSVCVFCRGTRYKEPQAYCPCSPKSG